MKPDCPARASNHVDENCFVPSCFFHILTVASRQSTFFLGRFIMTRKPFALMFLLAAVLIGAVQVQALAAGGPPPLCIPNLHATGSNCPK